MANPDDRAARQQRANDIAGEIEDLCARLLDLRSVPVGDENLDPNDGFLEKVSADIVRRCEVVRSSTRRQLPGPMIVTIKYCFGAKDGELIARLVREWDPVTESYRFVTVPIRLRLIVRMIERELREFRRSSGILTFSWWPRRLL